jgi:hypothetical protein
MGLQVRLLLMLHQRIAVYRTRGLILYVPACPTTSKLMLLAMVIFCGTVRCLRLDLKAMFLMLTQLSLCGLFLVCLVMRRCVLSLVHQQFWRLMAASVAIFAAAIVV